MKFKQKDFAMETCLQFYILTTLREKVLIYNLGETIFMIFSQAILCHQLENTPIDLGKDSLYRSYTLIKIILLMEMSPMTGEIYLHQITKSNIIIPVIGDISIT